MQKVNSPLIFVALLQILRQYRLSEHITRFKTFLEALTYASEFKGWIIPLFHLEPPAPQLQKDRLSPAINTWLYRIYIAFILGNTGHKNLTLHTNKIMNEPCCN